MSQSSSYAIFGGSFNPIHRGHLSVVESLLKLPLERLFLVPTSRSPFKSDEIMLPNELRWEMVKRTFANWERVEVSDLEIRQTAIAYTYHTLAQLSRQFPSASWHVVMGWDAYQSFPQWRAAQEILQKASLWIVQRSGPLAENSPKVGERLQAILPSHWFPHLIWDTATQSLQSETREVLRYLAVSTPEISSSAIRSGKAGLEWIPAPALPLYQEHLQKRPLSPSFSLEKY